MSFHRGRPAVKKGPLLFTLSGLTKSVFVASEWRDVRVLDHYVAPAPCMPTRVIGKINLSHYYSVLLGFYILRLDLNLRF